MIVVDETPECHNALRFAARRAANTGGGVVMLYVIKPEEFQHWVGVGEIMRAEAREAAEARLLELTDEVSEAAGIIPEYIIREGVVVEEVMAHIDEDPEIGVLVLGAGTDKKSGPGPLVTQLSRNAGSLPVPITIVPGDLSKERLEAIT